MDYNNNNNKKIYLSNYLQNYIIKILCDCYNQTSQSFYVKKLDSSSQTIDRSNNNNKNKDEYYHNDYIDNIIFVNKYWMKSVSNNINTIINFNNKLNNKTTNIKQFINLIKPQQSQSQNNSSVLIQNNNITTLVLDFTCWFYSFLIFFLVSKSKTFKKHLNNKILEYPNLERIRINNSELQFQIELANSIATGINNNNGIRDNKFNNIGEKRIIPIELRMYSMSVSRNEDGMDFDLEEIEENLYESFTKEEVEDQKDLFALEEYEIKHYYQAIPLSNYIKKVDYINFIQGDNNSVFSTINNLNQLGIFIHSESNIIIELYNRINSGLINGKSLTSLVSYNFNELTFKDLYYFLKLAPNLQTVLLRVCLDHINHIFMDSTDDIAEFSGCQKCSSTNPDSVDEYWFSIYNYIINSKSIEGITFIHSCKKAFYATTLSKRLSNGFNKIYNNIINNKTVKIFNIPFLTSTP